MSLPTITMTEYQSRVLLDITVSALLDETDTSTDRYKALYSLSMTVARQVDKLAHRISINHEYGLSRATCEACDWEFTGSTRTSAARRGEAHVLAA